MEKLYLLLFVVTLLPLYTRAQSKITAPTAIWPELQLNYGVGRQGILFLQNQYRINSDARYNDLKENGVLSNFERVQLLVGYEHTFTDHWRAGGMLRYAIEDFPKILYTSAFLRHSGNIGSFFFNKQGMFDYVSQESRDPYARFRAAAELGKRIPVGTSFLTPSIGYEAFVVTDFQQRDGAAAERAIDRTRLRLEVTYEVNERFRITSFFTRQTDYYYVLIGPKYDENMVLLEDGYTAKRNRIGPIFGLELKYNINTPPNTGSITY